MLETEYKYQVLKKKQPLKMLEICKSFMNPLIKKIIKYNTPLKSKKKKLKKKEHNMKSNLKYNKTLRK